MSVDEWANYDYDCKARQLAQPYVIARDFNEFREGHWQMIWRLQKP